MGASAIITGLSSRIAQTLVDLGVDLSMMRTVGDLQGGLEEAERSWATGPSRDAAPPPGVGGPGHVRRHPASGRLSDRVDPVGPTDSEVLRLREDLLDRVGGSARAGSSSTSAALDVIDSFVARALRRSPPRRGCAAPDGGRRASGRTSRSRSCTSTSNLGRCAPRSTWTRRANSRRAGHGRREMADEVRVEIRPTPTWSRRGRRAAPWRSRSGSAGRTRP